MPKGLYQRKHQVATVARPNGSENGSEHALVRDGPRVGVALEELGKTVATWRELVDSCLTATIGLHMDSDEEAPAQASEVEVRGCGLVESIRDIQRVVYFGIQATHALETRLGRL